MEDSCQRSAQAWLQIDQFKGPSQPHAPVPVERGKERCTAPLPFRICFRADLYPREYFPDLTTRARREDMDSEDLAAFDFLVGAMAVGSFWFPASREVLRSSGREE